MQHAQSHKFRVLIGDSSVRSRLVLSGMFNAEPFLEVVDTAQTQEELLYKAFDLQPDVIVAQPGLTVSGKLPFFMPIYDAGSQLLVMVSQRNEQFADHILYGAKQEEKVKGEATFRQIRSTMSVKQEVLEKLRNWVQTCSKSLSGKTLQPKLVLPRVKGHDIHLPIPQEHPLCVVVVGASTGGSTALEYVVRDLEVAQPTVVLVALHMPEKFTKRLARRLQKLTNWRVEEGVQGMRLKANTVIIAPGGKDMLVRRNALQPEYLTLDLVPAVSPVQESPSVDVLMQSAAACAGENVLGVIMTGMGQDGTKGAKEIRNKGGVIIAQNAATSSIFGMAKSAIENGVVNGVVALGQIHSMISRFAADRHLSQALQSELSR
ncbi:hypothetical protein GU926_01635 [Nibribacter ruber]|uniref:protein-glutamate methylesterase n=1 Tax=Nibribacter ruber TaxID=2698458 RepID=A0A6P1NRB1_9BACT|nr:chemotaxis protein CheB [Nibribacter ruber]QHL86217.1 hypothetical protein GU926_01635 [Nibribacter ruber]